MNMTNQRRTQLQFCVTATTTALFAGYAWGDASASTKHHNHTGHKSHSSHSQATHHKSVSARQHHSTAQRHRTAHLKSLYAAHKSTHHGSFKWGAKHIASTRHHTLIQSAHHSKRGRWHRSELVAHNNDGSARRIKRHHYSQTSFVAHHSRRRSHSASQNWIAKVSHKSHHKRSYQAASWKHTKSYSVAQSYKKHSHKTEHVATHSTKQASQYYDRTASNATNRIRPEAEAPTAANEIVRTAYAYRGTPYRFGASRPGAFDCSGFTQYVYSRKGINLPRTAAEQFHSGKAVTSDKLKPGDLIFFHTTRPGISHVGMYVGNGKFVHSASRKSGGVRVDNLNGYYKKAFRGARRFMREEKPLETAPTETTTDTSTPSNE